jgi:hypothetical protein
MMKRQFVAALLTSVLALSVAQAGTNVFYGPTHLTKERLQNVVIKGPADLRKMKFQSLSVFGPLSFDRIEVKETADIKGPVTHSYQGRFGHLLGKSLVVA